MNSIVIFITRIRFYHYKNPYLKYTRMTKIVIQTFGSKHKAFQIELKKQKYAINHSSNVEAKTIVTSPGFFALKFWNCSLISEDKTWRTLSSISFIVRSSNKKGCSCSTKYFKLSTKWNKNIIYLLQFTSSILLMR